MNITIFGKIKIMKKLLLILLCLPLIGFGQTFNNYSESIKYAEQVNKPVLITFTGWSCTNCRMMEDNVFSESSRINSTFGGNLVDMTRFKIILEIIEEEDLLLNSKKIGNYLLKNLLALQDDYPAYITNARGLGLWAAFDLPSITERDDLWAEMMKNKLLILSSGDKSIRFRPYLNAGEKEIDHALEIINKSIKNCLK